jgi:cob(I)alamin adenosyltransferase
MGHRLSKIYTRTGDKGETGLGDGSRIAKSDLRIKCMGLLDELNASIGIVLSYKLENTVFQVLIHVQHSLFDIGGEVCIPGRIVIEQSYVDELEINLDKFNAHLQPLKEFILPGGCQASAFCHQARTICRRVESELTALAETTEVNPISLMYLNRLSDLLFVTARYINHIESHPDVLWQPGYRSNNQC